MYKIDFPFTEDIEWFYFSGGEPHVKVPSIPDDKVYIRYNGRSWEDFGPLLALLNALYHQKKEVLLAMPYFPGARQDRNPGGNTPLTVEMYAQILGPYVSKLLIADIHSAEALRIIAHHIKETHLIHPYEILRSFSDIDPDFIIAPDKGALQRAGAVASALKIPLIQCEKVRDFDTGHITGYSMPDDLQTGRYLVVDDICDGGATFNILAESFYKNFTEEELRIDVELNLYVTHGIFSKGFKDLLINYDHIYTTDSLEFYIDSDIKDQVTVIPLNIDFFVN